jgi:hypothetical protein
MTMTDRPNDLFERALPDDLMPRGDGTWLARHFLPADGARQVAAEWARQRKRGGELLNVECRVVARFEYRGGPFESVSFTEVSDA